MIRNRKIAIVLSGLLAAIMLCGYTIVGYLDMSLMSAPGNPASGFLRLWSDSGSTTIKCKTAAGAACYFTAAAGSSVQIQTNGVDNSSQVLLNLVSGGSVVVTNTSGGNVSITGPAFQVGGVSNSSQTSLNLVAGSGITLTNTSGGNVSIASSGSGLTLQTDGTPNGSQTLLNLHAGTGVTLTDNGSGQITIASSGTGLTLQTDGTPNGSQSLLNLHGGTGITLTDNGSGQVTVASAGGSGSVTSVATQYPLTGGAITTTGTVACVTCTVTVTAGQLSLGTGAVASGACVSAVTATATDVIVSFPYTDLVIGSTTTQLTSAAHPFGSSHVGAYLTITSGSGFTTGIYRVLSVSGSTATMDRSVGTASSTGGNGVLKGDNIQADFDVDPTGTTGYVPGAMLTIVKYPTAGNVNFKVCNNSQASITPSAVKINYTVTR